MTVKTLLCLYDINLEEFLSNYPLLKNLRNSKNFELSGGELRLLEVLLILESKNIFSILDEPFSHLIPIHKEFVKERIKRVKRNKGIFLTDQQCKNVMEICDIYCLLKDRVVKLVEGERELRTL